MPVPETSKISLVIHSDLIRKTVRGQSVSQVVFLPLVYLVWTLRQYSVRYNALV
jgi:hypothetical protein